MKTKNKVFIGSGMIFLLMLLAGIGLVSAYGPWGDSCPGSAPASSPEGRAKAGAQN